MFKCPYCNKDSNYKSWYAVNSHIMKCSLNNKEYYISIEYGPLHYSEFCNTTETDILNKYPKLQYLTRIKSRFAKDNIILTFKKDKFFYTKDEIINCIQSFYKEHSRIPQARDFSNTTKYPNATTVITHFDTWNNAIKIAGFEPKLFTVYNSQIKADDGQIYRSNLESDFVNKFLFKKHDYIYEPKYDNSNKRYDFYLPNLDLYIEVDGQIRHPSIMQEKIRINKEENKKLLILTSKEIYSNKEIQCLNYR